MRLQRGSGIAGLSGIRAIRHEGDLAIVRPLLGWTKAELVEIVREAGIEPVDDPSNRDPRFDRARLRGRLADLPWLEPAALADRKSTRLNSSHQCATRMPSSALQNKT